MMPDMPDEPGSTTRVWDLPTRLFHWTLALAMVGSVASAKVGGNAMLWHFRLGYLVLALIAFRLLWGVVGGRWSRFASFIYAPATMLRYLRGQAQPAEHLEVGHNPLGSLSVFALLGFIAMQLATGLVADDEIANVGPLNRLVSGDIAATATSWHKSWGQWALLALVALHIAAIVYYRVRHRKNLVQAMVTGDKTLPAGTPASVDGQPQRLLALALAALCAGVVAWLVQSGP
jgi:cytochrome b